MSWVPAYGLELPGAFGSLNPPSLAAGALIDATGEKVGWIGRAWWPDRSVTSKNISRLGFRFGGVTKAGGSALTVSCQGIAAAAGNPYAPDETPVQTVAVANADAGFTSNVWYRTAALSAVRATSYGELFSVVIEYDGGGRLGADSVVLASLSGVQANAKNAQGSTVLKTAGWARLTQTSNLVLEFDDGTWGTFRDYMPFSGVNTHTYNSGSAADEIALQFTVPAPIKIDGAWINVLLAGTTSDVDIVLYNGTTVMTTVTVDGNMTDSLAGEPAKVVFSAEQTLLPGNTYYLSAKPTTANNIAVYSFDVNDANHLTLWAGGIAHQYASRVDAGAWTPITTRRPLMGLLVSATLAGLPASRAILGM